MSRLSSCEGEAECSWELPSGSRPFSVAPDMSDTKDWLSELKRLWEAGSPDSSPDALLSTFGELIVEIGTSSVHWKDPFSTGLCPLELEILPSSIGEADLFLVPASLARFATFLLYVFWTFGADICFMGNPLFLLGDWPKSLFSNPRTNLRLKPFPTMMPPNATEAEDGDLCLKNLRLLGGVAPTGASSPDAGLTASGAGGFLA